MSIKNSSKVLIRGKPTLNNVRGNQINHTKTIITNVVSGAKERDEYEEFEYVKRGHIVTIKDVHSQELEDRELVSQGNGTRVSGRLLRKTKRRICTVELHSDRLSSQTRKFTAFIYEDDDARSFWEDDFREFSRNRTTDSLQLFGVNRSEIPILIFHHELVPLGHFYKSSFWGDIYLAYLSRNKQSAPVFLWMNTAGSLCHGPKGPAWRRSFSSARETISEVPSSREMLESDASFRFLSKFKSKALNDYVLGWAQRQWEYIQPNDLLPTTAGDLSSEDRHRFDWRAEYPYLEHVWQDTDCRFPVDIPGSIRFDTVYSPTRGAVARSPQINGQWMLWQTRTSGFNSGCSGNDVLLINRLTRFKLEASTDIFSHFSSLTWCKFEAKESTLNLEFRFEWYDFERGWISQVPHFSNALQLSGNEERFFTIQPPSLGLRMLQSPRQYDGLGAFFRLCDAKKPPLIYLFVHPPPICISEFKHWLEGNIPTHFWSLDETGQSQMSEDELEEWGIPKFEPRLSPIDPDDSLARATLLHCLPPHICRALRDWQIAQGYDPSTADYARYMGYPEYEIVNEPWPGQAKTPESHQAEDQEDETEKEAVHESTWWEAIPGSGISAFGF
ncbi:hypothetical protein VNI00_013108 [Paramarasmius palmivorus]|uniref:Uncharacterized protein n=1 Tax=Paramarasmius palmivorus TaxID=297713 RepID=A0AAW0C189_9AGAR